MNDEEAPDAALLSTSFSFSHPTLICSRARLYEDRLELTGWRLWGRYRRRIPLRRILQADATGANRLLLWLADGQALRLCIDNARRWEQAIARRLEEA